MYTITVEQHSGVQFSATETSKITAYRALLAWLRRERMLQHTHVWTLDHLQREQVPAAAAAPLCIGWVEGGGPEFYIRQS